MEKTCTKCGITKEISLFGVDKRKPSGHTSTCRACNAAYRSQYKKDNIEKIRKAIRLKPKKKVKRKNCYRDTKIQLQKHPERAKAYGALHYALRKGKIIRPERCEICDSTGKMNAHHPDYSRPLEVIWLCMRCHKDIHMK